MTNLVSEHHETPVGLSSQDTTDTLCGMSHGVESEVVVLPDPVVVAKELKACF